MVLGAVVFVSMSPLPVNVMNILAGHGIHMVAELQGLVVTGLHPSHRAEVLMAEINQLRPELIPTVERKVTLETDVDATTKQMLAVLPTLPRMRVRSQAGPSQKPRDDEGKSERTRRNSLHQDSWKQHFQKSVMYARSGTRRSRVR